MFLLLAKSTAGGKACFSIPNLDITLNQMKCLQTIQGGLVDWAPLLREVEPAVRRLLGMAPQFLRENPEPGGQSLRSVRKSNTSVVRTILPYLAWFDMQTASLGHKKSFLGINQQQVVKLYPQETEAICVFPLLLVPYVPRYLHTLSELPMTVHWMNAGCLLSIRKVRVRLAAEGI
jgi:hypothetical protein